MKALRSLFAALFLLIVTSFYALPLVGQTTSIPVPNYSFEAAAPGNNLNTIAVRFNLDLSPSSSLPRMVYSDFRVSTI